MVNEALASRFFPGANPIGQRIKQGISDDVYQIVGVAPNLESLTLADEAFSRGALNCLFTFLPGW